MGRGLCGWRRSGWIGGRSFDCLLHFFWLVGLLVLMLFCDLIPMVGDLRYIYLFEHGLGCRVDINIPTVQGNRYTFETYTLNIKHVLSKLKASIPAPAYSTSSHYSDVYAHGYTRQENHKDARHPGSQKDQILDPSSAHPVMNPCMCQYTKPSKNRNIYAHEQNRIPGNLFSRYLVRLVSF